MLKFTRIRRFINQSRAVALLIELLAIPALFILGWWLRSKPRPVAVGLGPEPLINNVHHKRALELAGYSAETFVSEVYYITDAFDYHAQDSWLLARLPPVLKPIRLFVRAIRRYRAVFIYFNGGPLMRTKYLRRFEPRLFRAAGVKVVVTAYGSDVQDLTQSNNLAFVHAVNQDYPAQPLLHPRVRENIDRWTAGADWVISGVEWVDYMFQWNTLMIGHFSIDLETWRPKLQSTPRDDAPLRVLHAPNHRAIKGTAGLVAAVEKLRAEGLPIELVILERLPNTEIQKAMEEVDLVADQFVIGWYAMFAIEAMALEKPVLCYLRPDLLDLYRKCGLLEHDELPLIDTPSDRIEERLRWAVAHRAELREIGVRGRQFVKKHHSLERIGAEFAQILGTLGIEAER